MTKLAVFSFGNHEIRTVTDEHGEAWFVANDVCAALELGNARQALETHVDAEDVQQMDTRAIGMAVVALGGGRRRASDTIDYSVGFSDFCQLGQWVEVGQPLAMVHARHESAYHEAAQALRQAIVLGDVAPAALPEVYRRIRISDIDTEGQAQEKQS